MYLSINPATEEVIAEYKNTSAAELSNILTDMNSAQSEKSIWRLTPIMIR